MDLEDAAATVTYLIRDRDSKFPALFDQILGAARIQVVLTGIRMPRINAIMERWVQTCRHELLDRTLIWNDRHLRHALRQFELHHNTHRPHQAINQAAPLRAVPEPLNSGSLPFLPARSGREVLRRLRRRPRRRRCAGPALPAKITEGERLRRTLGRHRPPRMHRPPAHHERAAPTHCPGHLHRPLQSAPPHQSLLQRPPQAAETGQSALATPPGNRIRRTQPLGGLINEYQQAA
ncbi:hypothetical protein GCM10009753_51770 [Streptantibioticus ferralitis]